MSTQANKPIIGENVLNFINNALREKARYSYLNEREWAKNPSKLPFRLFASKLFKQELNPTTIQ